MSSEDKGRGTLRPRDAHSGSFAIKWEWEPTNDARKDKGRGQPQPREVHLDSFGIEKVGERPAEPTEGRGRDHSK